MSATRQHILKLYKDLLRYGETLQHTDKDFYIKRIKKEFKKNKNLEEASEINFNYKVNITEISYFTNNLSPVFYRRDDS